MRRPLSSISIILCLWASSIAVVRSANILITVMSIAGSQNLIMYRLADLMGERGHNVTVLRADFFPEAKSIKLKYANEIVYKVVADEETLNLFRSNMVAKMWDERSDAPWPMAKFFELFRRIRESCEHLLERDEFIDRLKSSRFDVIVIHVIDFCTFGLTRVLGVDSYVWMNTAPLMDAMAWYSGSPLAQAYVPNLIAPSNADGRLSLIDRLKNTAMSTVMMAVFQYGVVDSYTEVYRKKYGRDFPHYSELLAKTQLYFSNSDPFFEYARPTPQNVINVGGLTMEKAEPLNETWQSIMDNAPEQGVVVFSMGSVVDTKSMPQHIRMAFLNAFKRLPHLFIWRFEGDFPEAKSVKNVHLASWLPQKDLLAHPKIKAAIIHGGYNSLTELTYLGVPVVIMPMWGDQFGNVVRATRMNIGVRLDRTNLTEEAVYEALTKVIYDESIQASSKRLGRMIREKPFSSYDQAVQWLEYLAEFKRLDQLQPQSAKLNFFEYFLADVIAIVIAVFIVFLLVTACCLRMCIRLCWTRCQGGGGGRKETRTDGGAGDKEKKEKATKAD